MLCVRNNGVYNGRIKVSSKLGHRSVNVSAEIARDAIGRDITEKERRLIEKRLAPFETHESKGESQEGEGGPTQ